MAGWKFTWARWLYHLPILATFLIVLAAYLLVDQSYLLSIARFEAFPDLPPSGRYRYFFGTMLLAAPSWYAATLAGALAGQAIPEEYALDFAVPIAFLAMVAPMLKTLPHLAAALTSVGLALALTGLPHGAGRETS